MIAVAGTDIRTTMLITGVSTSSKKLTSLSSVSVLNSLETSDTMSPIAVNVSKLKAIGKMKVKFHKKHELKIITKKCPLLNIDEMILYVKR